MYPFPRRALELTIWSCVSLPHIKADDLWKEDALLKKFNELKHAKEDASARLQQYHNNQNYVGPNLDREQTLLQMAVINAQDAYHKFVESFGQPGASSDKKISPNCYVAVTLDRDVSGVPFAKTDVKRGTHSPCWNLNKKDINLDWMLLYSSNDATPYMACERFRFSIYHDLGLENEASDSEWVVNETTKGFHIGDAFISLAEVLYNPCAKRHELKVVNTRRMGIQDCILHVETKVACKTENAQMMGCAGLPGFMPGYVPVEAERSSCYDPSQVSQSASIAATVVPSAVHLATSSKRKCHCKKCKSKHKHKSHHCC